MLPPDSAGREKERVSIMWGILIAILSGILMSVQGVFNKQVAKASAIWAAAAYVQASALVVCLAAWLLRSAVP